MVVSKKKGLLARKTKTVTDKKGVVKHKQDRLTIFFVIFLVSLIGYFFYQYNLNSNNQQVSLNYSKKVGLKKLNSYTKEASGTTLKNQKSSTNSAVIPKNYGRSVNVPTLYYHYIGNNPNPADKIRDSLSITPDKFEQEMAYLVKNGFNTISYDTLAAALKGNLVLPSKSLILTFDDGYVDFYVNAFPILRKLNIRATVFIPTGLMEQGYYLQWSQIKEMDATGLISFQAHSVNHVNLAGLSGDQLKYQISTSKKTLEEKLGKPVNFMAYPYGQSNPNVWNEVKKAGFLGAAGTWGGSLESEGNIYDMPRIRMGGNISIEEFARKI